jgi:tripeptide aminopeptidase
MQVPRDRLVERFLRYVKIDTQSSEEVTDRYPSTEKQKDLLHLLVEELKALGLNDAAMDEWGYVTATLPSNLPAGRAANVPAIGLVGHVDTSPEVSGADVKPVTWEKYAGADLVLPGDKSQVLRVADNPDLKDYLGWDLITSDGTTLLGADDKAGVAEIMTALDVLIHHPDWPRPTVRVAFTPDEEVGAGTAHFSIEKFGVQAAYTVDGGHVGEIENETFNAFLATFNVTGVNVHPGYAKGKMVNAARVLAYLIERLADQPAPETTEGREAYLHPYAARGEVSQASLKILIRSFTDQGIQERKDLLERLRQDAARRFPGAGVELEIHEQYKNMRVYLDQDPRVVEFALQAARRAGLNPELKSIRGGTDGARLSEKGLPTPNLFAGGHNFHSKLEYVPIQSMEKAVETVAHLLRLWAEA